MIAFTTWIFKLDKKFRLVLPLRARNKLGITDSVVLELIGDTVIIKKTNGEDGILISRNCRRVK